MRRGAQPGTGRLAGHEPAAAGYRWLHLLNALLFAGLWLFTIVMYHRLPDLVPGHIGTSGVTRWEPRGSGMWFVVPVMAAFHVLLAYALSTLAHGSPASINVPQKKRLLALPREGQQYALEPLRGFMYGLATWLLLVAAWVQLHIYRTAMAAQRAEPETGGLLGGVIALASLPLLGALWLSRAIGRRIAAWERLQAGDD
jgi:hypothetical protein